MTDDHAQEPIRVLIVDDDPWVTRALYTALKGVSEIQVVATVQSGEDAVRSHALHRPDVVLMDINMPSGISGIEAASSIIRDDPLAKIIMLTTIAPGPGIARAIEAGALAVLSKNASAQTLVAALESAVRGDEPALIKTLAKDIVISGDLPPDFPPALPRLTQAELQTLHMICNGETYDEIAMRRGISVHTVKAQSRSLREKLHAQSLAQLVLRAIQYRFFSI